MTNTMPRDANGFELNDGDRVYAYDIDRTKVFGKLHWDVKYWYVAYDDGEENIVLDFNQLWKA